MTRIAFLTHSGADSGAEQSTVTYLSHWPDPAPRPVFLIAQRGPIAERAASAGVDTVTVPLDAAVASTRRDERRPGRLFAAVTGLLRHSSKVRRELQARRAQVVVATSVKSLVFGWWAGRRLRATVVWGLHDRVDRAYFSTLVTPVLRYVVPRLVDGILVNSRSTLDTIRPGRTPVLVATPPIDLDPRTFHEPHDEMLRVVMMGRLTPWKGQDVFLRSFAEAFEDSPAQAYVVGGALFGEHDYEAELKALAMELGISDRVHFTGHVPDPWELLVDADVLAHCSRIPEPFGQVVVQGMWAKCAVVATSPGGPAEVITQGHDGLLVPSGDQDALTGALTRLRQDPALARRLARRARESARRFDASVMAPVLSAWLDDLHERHVPAGSVSTVLVESLR